MKKVIIFAIVSVLTMSILAQEEAVEVKGVGPTRQEAVQDAQRMAIGKVAGVILTSKKIVENFVPIQDAVSTKTEGVIKSFEVIDENKMKDAYEVTISAIVSTDPLEQDINSLADMLGSLNFIVLYDERKLTEEEKPFYEYTYERINQKLTEYHYDITEATLFKKIMKVLPENDTSQVSFLNKMGMYTNSEFIILIKDIHLDTREKGDGVMETSIRVEAKAYDNCNFKLLATVPLDYTAYWNKNTDEKARVMEDGLESAIMKKFDEILIPFNKYMGNWVNSGAPYELRFYTEMRYRAFSELKNKLQNDPQFGGQMNLLSAGNYKKVQVTFTSKQVELIDKVMAAIYEVETLAGKDLEPQVIYGRQVSFAPYGEQIKAAKEKEMILQKISAQ
jgi:hypothetical protein